MNDPDFTGRPPESVDHKLLIKTLTVSIKLWDAVGDDAYNVASPHRFTVKRW